MEFAALRIRQPSGRDVFAFSAIAEDLLAVATIPHIKRNDQRNLVGYQRPEVASHITEIRRYLETEDAVLANAIVVAFDERVSFEVIMETPSGDYGRLIVPLADSDTRPVGFVVDGQQRLAAVSSCSHERFPIFVTALIAATEAEQRKQFVLVNRTKPLPQGLIFELLPQIDGVLPTALARQHLAATLTTLLNLDPESSLFGLVNTPTTPSGVVKDNSLRRLLTNSLSDGALLSIAYEKTDLAARNHAMINVVSTFWSGVVAVFAHASTVPPTKSRLTHGVGMAALGYVMDYLYLRRGNTDWTPSYVAECLELLTPHCAWTSGEWAFETGARRWNDLQNIDRDIRALTGHFRLVLSKIKTPSDSQGALARTSNP
jgi:DGQHR domain-containing protein